jgi:hypothetical protein
VTPELGASIRLGVYRSALRPGPAHCSPRVARHIRWRRALVCVRHGRIRDARAWSSPVRRPGNRAKLVVQRQGVRSAPRGAERPASPLCCRASWCTRGRPSQPRVRAYAPTTRESSHERRGGAPGRPDGNHRSGAIASTRTTAHDLRDSLCAGEIMAYSEPHRGPNPPPAAHRP